MPSEENVRTGAHGDENGVRSQKARRAQRKNELVDRALFIGIKLVIDFASRVDFSCAAKVLTLFNQFKLNNGRQ